MKWKYRWAALLIPLLAACASLTPVTSTAVVTPTATEVSSPTATATAIPLPTPTVVPTVKPTSSLTRVVDPSVQDFVSQLNDLGVQTRLKRSQYAGCIGGFYGYIAGNGVKYGYGEVFDLRPFGDEESASDLATKIKVGRCDGPDWLVELPYFRCGALFAFVQSTDKDLLNNFEELCGPPFAKTRIYGSNSGIPSPFEPDAIPPAATATPITLPSPTVAPNVTESSTPSPRVANPFVQDFISKLNARGVTTRLTGRIFADSNCMFEHESVLHGYNSGRGIEFGFGDRFDLYPFADERSASDVASKIPPDAECRGGSRIVDWVCELPYYQCGELIAFVQSSNENLQSTFEDLCGPPFARTVARFPAPN